MALQDWDSIPGKDDADQEDQDSNIFKSFCLLVIASFRISIASFKYVVMTEYQQSELISSSNASRDRTKC